MENVLQSASPRISMVLQMPMDKLQPYELKELKRVANTKSNESSDVFTSYKTNGLIAVYPTCAFENIDAASDTDNEFAANFPNLHQLFFTAGIYNAKKLYFVSPAYYAEQTTIPQKVLNLSTAHLHPDTLLRLETEEKNDWFRVFRKDTFGFYIMPTKQRFPTSTRCAAITPDLVQCFLEANLYDCQFIEFDCDEPVCTNNSNLLIYSDEKASVDKNAWLMTETMNGKIAGIHVYPSFQQAVTMANIQLKGRIFESQIAKPTGKPMCKTFATKHNPVAKLKDNEGVWTAQVTSASVIA